jgi:hypothetical protein
LTLAVKGGHGQRRVDFVYRRMIDSASWTKAIDQGHLARTWSSSA